MVKLISFNIGIKLENSKEVGNFLLKENPDIIAFQEIMRHFESSVFEIYKSQHIINNILKDKFKYSFFGPLFIAKNFTKNGQVHRDLGGFVEQGNEIKSKFPILNASNNFYYGNYSYDSDRTNFIKKDHSRAFQVIELSIGGKEIRIINVHGTYSKDKLDFNRSLKQSEYILEEVNKKDIPTIIVGDFNLFPNTQSIKMLEKSFKNLIKEYNINSTRPNFNDDLDEGNNVVDYIFVDDKIKVDNFKVIDTNISDHLPLILDFEFK